MKTDEQMKPLTDYLRTMGLMIDGGDWQDKIIRGENPSPKSFYGFILAHGMSGVLTPEDRAKPRRFDLMEMKECYYNSQLIALRNGLVETDVVYCEGSALKLSLGISVDHAWLLDRDGVVHDLTWREDTTGEKSDWLYIGVPVKTDYLMSRLFDEDEWSSRCRGEFRQPETILQDYAAGHPIQSGKIPEDHWKVSRDWFDHR